MVSLCAACALVGCSSSPDKASGPPVNVAKPLLVRTGASTPVLSGQLRLTDGSWSGGALRPVSFRFSWLRCDLRGVHCHRIRGFVDQRITPPQGLRTFTIRGAVRAVGRGGSAFAISANYFFDEAGLPLTSWEHRRAPSVVDPAEVRAWYGLGPQETGAGQTIVMASNGRPPYLARSVNAFSRHYDLPTTCKPRRRENATCFRFAVMQPAGRPFTNRGDDPILTVEWVHAIAPRARIIVVESKTDYPGPILRTIGRLGRSGVASVFSNSWCDPCRGHHAFAHRLDGLVAQNCKLPHGVCVFTTTDNGPPGDTPANSPDVLAVGGSQFRVLAGAITGEVAWPDGAGGTTDTPLPQPIWQRNLCRPRSCRYREIPDVSATAGPLPNALRTPSQPLGWRSAFGTSVSAPLWAGLLAVTDQLLARHGSAPIGVNELHNVLYRGNVAAGLDDIGAPGWDRETGWGSPKSGIADVLERAIERYRQHMLSSRN